MEHIPLPAANDDKALPIECDTEEREMDMPGYEPGN